MTPAQKEKRINIVHNLKAFKDAIIEVASEIPPEYEKERERFIQHAWNAYMISISVHDEICIWPSEIIGNINQYTLSKLYQTVCNRQNACANSSANDSEE